MDDCQRDRRIPEKHTHTECLTHTAESDRCDVLMSVCTVPVFFCSDDVMHIIHTVSPG